MTVLDALKPVSFGQRVAEEESDSLSAYFVETDDWRRILADRIDIVYGSKGAGKSALYALLVARANDLLGNDVLLALGENPRGAPAFRSLVNDPPASEREFIALWKLYFACLASTAIEDHGISSPSSTELHRLLEQSGLKEQGRGLQATLHAAFEYVKRVLRPSAIEGTVQLDPATQMPVGLGGKIIFGEPSARQASAGIASVDRLLQLADDALTADKCRLWILLDRLDVAFTESPQLETNALRALFHAYLDCLGLKSMRVKVFLRTDIWRRITAQGFREASHITRDLTIEWDKASLLNLMVRRIAQNESILEHVKMSREEALASAKSQEALFYRIFPDQVDTGLRKSTTLDWMIGRTMDGSRRPAPRELIHLLNSLRDNQVRRLEMGDNEPDDGRLFGRAVFKDALVEVSRVRLQQTVYAEYPELRGNIESLRGQKATQNIESLGAIWGKSPEEALGLARKLTEVGFFEERGEKSRQEFWVPFLYRDALDLVQGAAE